MSIKETLFKNLTLTLVSGIMLREKQNHERCKTGSFYVFLVVATVLGFYGLFLQPMHDTSSYSVGQVLTKEELGIDFNRGHNISSSPIDNKEDISVLIIMRNFEKSEMDYVRKIRKELSKRYRINDNSLFLLTATPLKEVAEVSKNKNVYNIDYNFSKKIIHANIGVIILEGNIIKSKWQQNSLHLQSV